MSSPISIPTPLLVQQSSVGGMTAFLLYELFLTLDREVSLFWNAPFTWGTALFLLNRYGSLAKYPLTLTDFVSVSQEGCDILVRLGEAVEIIPYIVWAAFSAMRAHALTARDWRLSVAVFALLSVPVCTNVYLFVMSVPHDMPAPFFCIYEASIPDRIFVPLLVLTRACAIAGDAIVVVVTWRKTFRGWRAAVAANMHVSLAHMLIRDGSIYFGVLLGLNVLHIVSALTTAYSGSIAYFEEPLTAVIISRIMLNLREVDQSSRIGEDGSAFSNVVFGSGSGGGGLQIENLGVALDLDLEDSPTALLGDERGRSATPAHAPAIHTLSMQEEPYAGSCSPV